MLGRDVCTIMQPLRDALFPQKIYTRGSIVDNEGVTRESFKEVCERELPHELIRHTRKAREIQKNKGSKTTYIGCYAVDLILHFFRSWHEMQEDTEVVDHNPALMCESYEYVMLNGKREDNNRPTHMRFPEEREKCIAALIRLGSECRDFSSMLVNHDNTNTYDNNIANLSPVNASFNQLVKRNYLLLDFLPEGSEFVTHIGTFGHMHVSLYCWRSALFIVSLMYDLDEYMPSRRMYSVQLYRIITNIYTTSKIFSKALKQYRSMIKTKKYIRLLEDYQAKRKVIYAQIKPWQMMYQHARTSEEANRINDRVVEKLNELEEFTTELCQKL